MKIRKYHFTWREGNRIRLLIDAGIYYPAMIDAINCAQESILLEMYLVESGHVADRYIQSFVDAAHRGVHVYLLFDAYGVRGLKQADRSRLDIDNIDIIYYNRLHFGKRTRNLVRDHRKLLIIDHKIGFVGGAGITNAFAESGEGSENWRETMVSIEGPVLADWQLLFWEVWLNAGGQFMATVRTPAPEAGGGMSARVTVASGIGAQGVMRSLMRHIRVADNLVWVSTAYFVPSRRFLRRLRRAARRGVDVRLLLPGPVTDHPFVRYIGQRHYARLLASGVRIFEYQSRMLHSKAALCDEWAMVGSCNFDRWGLRWNLEANQGVRDIHFASEMRKMFEGDFAQSLEIRLDDWLRRPIYFKWRERFWHFVERILARVGGRY